MKTESFHLATAGFVALALAGCLSLTCRGQDKPPGGGRDGSVHAQADADAKSVISGAIAKLADAPNYRWTTTVAVGEPPSFGRGGGVTAGQTEKGGFTRVALPGPDRPEFVTRGGKTAILLDGNWQQASAIQAARGGGPPGRAIGLDPRMIADFRLPAVGASELVDKASAFHREGNTVTATLSPDVAARLLEADAPRRGGRPGRGRDPVDTSIKEPRGSVTFRVDGGVLAEFTLSLAGSRKIFDNEIKLDRSTTTKIGEVGTVKIEVPEDAREVVEALLAGVKPNVFVPEPGFRKLFDGRTLAGWEGRPGFWAVLDRAIVGRTTKENPLRGNTFLFAKAAGKNLIVDDFELRLSYRITADNDAGFANSGIQYRSRDRASFVAAGYQADFEAGPVFSGILYDEGGGAGGRGIMANRGEKVTWTSDGKKEVTGRLGSSREIQAKIRKDDWNEYAVVARGNHLQHFINGVPTVDVFDDTESKRLDSGILALQLHAGQPMTVRFKDIRIKSLRSAAESAAGNVRVAKGFKLDLIYSVPKETQGSWVALCVDPKGRLIAADQNGKLYRMTPPALGRSGSVEPEAIGVDLAGVHGLLYAFDSLYAMVNERGTHGLYRVRDTDGDDRYDEVKLLREIKGGGEHGMHSIVLSPDGKSLYVVCGNSTELTKVDSLARPAQLGRGQPGDAHPDRIHGRLAGAAGLDRPHRPGRQGMGADRGRLPKPVRHRLQPRRRAVHLRRRHGMGHRRALVSAHARQPRHQRRRVRLPQRLGQVAGLLSSTASGRSRTSARARRQGSPSATGRSSRRSIARPCSSATGASASSAPSISRPKGPAIPPRWRSSSAASRCR